MTDRWVLQIDKVRDDGGRLVLVARGEVDLMSSPLLANAIDHARRRGHALVLDLAGVTFLDSTGLHAIIKAAREADREGWTLLLRPELHEDVHKLMMLSGCADALPWDGEGPRQAPNSHPASSTIQGEAPDAPSGAIGQAPA